MDENDRVVGHDSKYNCKWTFDFFEIFSLQLQGLTLFGVKIIVSIFFFTSINYELFFS